MPDLTPLYDQCIIGAGIIGLAIASALVHAGQSVIVLDGQGMAHGASAGNAGAFAFADVEPLASPATLASSPRWLLDPLGPLSVPSAHASRMVPWMVQFARACLPHRLAASTRAQAALMVLAREETLPLFARAGLATHLRQEGALYLYAGARAFDAAAPLWRTRAAHGVAFEPVSGDRLAALQPGLGATYTHAMFVPDWLMASDPYTLTVGLGEDALARGMTFRQVHAAAVTPSADDTRIDLEDGTAVRARHAIIAAGVWSRGLAARLGDRVPLEAERGYNTTLPRDAFDLRRQLVLPADGYVITPLSTGIRIGGAAEFAGLKRPPDFRRSAAMLRKAQGVMTGLRTGNGTQWMGMRPSMPDSLPVIGRSSASPRVLYAFGHGHLGLTQSAATARIVRDLALGARPPTDLAPYRPERF